MDLHGLRLLSAQLLCIASFLLWPLRFRVERPELDGLFGWLFELLMGFDKPFNQAPSLHIALLVVLWALYARYATGLWRWLLHGWFGLIGLSVLTTWQHHFIDVPTGVLVGWLCLWLWPEQGHSPLAGMRLARDAQRWRLALGYAVAAGLCLLLAIVRGGAWLWLACPALSLLLVALNYALFGAEGFQKQGGGRLSRAASWLLAPYLVMAWLNARAWTHRQRPADQVGEGGWLGLVQHYWAQRVALDAELFQRLAQSPARLEEQAAQLDSALARLGLRSDGAPPRTWPERCRAALRLLRVQLAWLLGQYLLALLLILAQPWRSVAG